MWFPSKPLPEDQLRFALRDATQEIESYIKEEKDRGNSVKDVPIFPSGPREIKLGTREVSIRVKANEYNLVTWVGRFCFLLEQSVFRFTTFARRP